jgi:hypothetical protein
LGHSRVDTDVLIDAERVQNPWDATMSTGKPVT